MWSGAKAAVRLRRPHRLGNLEFGVRARRALIVVPDVVLGPAAPELLGPDVSLSKRGDVSRVRAARRRAAGGVRDGGPLAALGADAILDRYIDEAHRRHSVPSALDSALT